VDKGLNSGEILNKGKNSVKENIRAAEGASGNIIKIIGFGNLFMGDDGIGVKVIEELRKQDSLKGANNIEIIDGGTSGVDLIFILKDADKAIIVDAVDAGQEIGEIKVFSYDDIKTVNSKNRPFKSFSMHDMDLAEVFELLKTLNLNKQIMIIGIKPKNIGYSDRLSPEIAEKIPEIINLIKKELQ